MTADQFRARLAELGLSQPRFARAVSDAGGDLLPLATVRGWAQGRRAIPPTVPALLELLSERAVADEGRAWIMARLDARERRT